MKITMASTAHCIGHRLSPWQSHIAMYDEIAVREADPAIADRLAGCGWSERPVAFGRFGDVNDPISAVSPGGDAPCVEDCRTVPAAVTSSVARAKVRPDDQHATSSALVACDYIFQRRNPPAN